MSRIHKVKHHVHHHKEKIKHHARRHKEKITHHVRRRKESLPQTLFNKNLVIVFLITLTIPLTVFLASQQQDLRKSASESHKPAVVGYIVEFNEKSLSEEVKSYSSTINSNEEKRKNVEEKHKKNKEEVLNIIGEDSSAQDPDTQSKSKVKSEYKNVINGVALDITEEEAQKIKKSPNVKDVYPNVEVKETLVQSVPLINADRVWSLEDLAGANITGKNINIAIIDSGVDYRHPDLGSSVPGQVFNSKVVGGYDFINNDNDPMDDRGHGTHVAGIVAGNGVLKGVAPDARIIAYKVLDSGGSGSFASVISGIDAAVGTRLDSDPANDVIVINLSLGAYCGSTYSSSCGPDDILSQAVDNATANGILSVIAAGNVGEIGSITTPGTARSALTVGSINKSKVISSFSSRGPVTNGSEIIQKPDVVAPGEDVCSAKLSATTSEDCIDSNHTALNGTSMATPHVVGMAALVKQQSPTYNVFEIKYMLVQNATDLGYDENTQGKGMVDASKIFILNPNLTPTPTPTITPAPSPIVLTLNPSGDAFVRSSAPNQNFGTNRNLQVDSSPNEIAYLKFNLRSLTGKIIINAKLRIKVSDTTSNPLNLRRGVAGGWSETGITYNKRPAFETTITTFNARTKDQVKEFNVTSAVNLRKGGTLTLGIVSTGNDTGAFYSRESSKASRPQLTIEYR